MYNDGIEPIESDYLTISFKGREYKMKVGLSESLLNDLKAMKDIKVKDEFACYIFDTINRLERDKIMEHLFWQPQYENTLPDDEEYHRKTIFSKYPIGA